MASRGGAPFAVRNTPKLARRIGTVGAPPRGLTLVAVVVLGATSVGGALRGLPSALDAGSVRVGEPSCERGRPNKTSARPLVARARASACRLPTKATALSCAVSVGLT